MKKNTFKNLVLLSTLLLPAVSFAALTGLKSLLGDFSIILGQVWTLVIALAFVYFFWGLGQFILHAGDQKARDEGKQKMIWGIIALFVIVSIGGILNFVGDLIDVRPNSGQFIP